MSEFKVDIGHFKMIVDFYDRKCPCWGGEHDCPCTVFVETMNCRCGAVRTSDDPKTQNPKFQDYKIDFKLLDKIVKNGHRCPENLNEVCFCEEFLKTGNCKLHVFKKLGNPA